MKMDKKTHILIDKSRKGVKPMDQGISVSEYLYRYMSDEGFKKILSNEIGTNEAP